MKIKCNFSYHIYIVYKGMPKNLTVFCSISDYSDDFAGWNLISSFGYIIVNVK